MNNTMRNAGYVNNRSIKKKDRITVQTILEMKATHETEMFFL